jgi:hypothetical protein
MQVKPPFSFERCILNKRPMGDRMLEELCMQTQGKAAMERCALCHGRLGLGTRFRNIWNGRWWVHVRFCSVRCESIYEVKRNDAAKQRWHAFLARGNLRICGFVFPLTNYVARTVKGAHPMKFKLAFNGKARGEPRTSVSTEYPARTEVYEKCQ